MLKYIGLPLLTSWSILKQERNKGVLVCRCIPFKVFDRFEQTSLRFPKPREIRIGRRLNLGLYEVHTRCGERLPSYYPVELKGVPPIRVKHIWLTLFCRCIPHDGGPGKYFLTYQRLLHPDLYCYFFRLEQISKNRLTVLRLLTGYRTECEQAFLRCSHLYGPCPPVVSSFPIQQEFRGN